MNSTLKEINRTQPPSSHLPMIWKIQTEAARMATNKAAYPPQRRAQPFKVLRICCRMARPMIVIGMNTPTP